MGQRNYWLDLFTWTTWQEFLEAGGTVSGFRETRWAATQRIKVGDHLLCYLIGVSRFIGVLEVTKAAFKDTVPIWKTDSFPSRVGVKVLVKLTPETAIPISELRTLSCFAEGKGKAYWTGYVRSSPALWKIEDGQIVTKAVYDAAQHPIKRDFDPQKARQAAPSSQIENRPGDYPRDRARA